MGQLLSPLLTKHIDVVIVNMFSHRTSYKIRHCLDNREMHKQLIIALHGMHRNIAENLNRLSRAHERYRRQPDNRQTDGP